jgi:hypothetical protein
VNGVSEEQKDAEDTNCNSKEEEREKRTRIRKLGKISDNVIHCLFV